MSKILVEFFYDVISPYSFLAFEGLLRYKPIWKLDLKLKPVLLASIMKNSGNSPPAVVPNKGAYMAADLKRLQKYFQVPLFIPDNLMDLIMKGGSINAQRFITAVDVQNHDYLEPISREMWLRLYKSHKDITEFESFQEAGKAIGMDEVILQKALQSISDSSTKQRLRKYTDEALNYGAFGAPVIVVHTNQGPEVFFGSDRFELIAHVIGKPWLGPVPKNASSKL